MPGPRSLMVGVSLMPGPSGEGMPDTRSLWGWIPGRKVGISGRGGGYTKGRCTRGWVCRGYTRYTHLPGY